MTIRRLRPKGADPPLRERWQGPYSHLLVDELQDVDAAQLRLVRILAEPERNLVVVGDDDQSIYGWRLADDNRVYLTWSEGLQEHDLSGAHDHDAVRAIVEASYPGEAAKRIINWTGQIWAFVVPMKSGDWVVLPRKETALVAIGELTGPYEYDPKAAEPFRHRRAVKWLNKEVPRSSFGQDLLYSFGAFMTVCAITRNDADKRVRAMPARAWKSEPGMSPPVPGVATEGDETPVDLELLARDQIAKLIMARYQGHGLARLVEALLRAQGYTTYRSPEGADKGVDILAATGPLGFGEPRICVQVKSGDSQVDRPTLDQLVGAMANFKADRGLLVSWGGFKGSVEKEVAHGDNRLYVADGCCSGWLSVAAHLSPCHVECRRPSLELGGASIRVVDGRPLSCHLRDAARRLTGGDTNGPD